ncbi:hypothetical protein DID73_00125 [Candidatus Marinamargulisbacteria bacterium SCGC AG-343-K17]|nr:hypothetical protein DID73_00125 [Candidatus Marinamargulisbacteria bacterium SCGC AG-343-K17]
MCEIYKRIAFQGSLNNVISAYLNYAKMRTLFHIQLNPDDSFTIVRQVEVGGRLKDAKYPYQSLVSIKDNQWERYREFMSCEGKSCIGVDLFKLKNPESDNMNLVSDQPKYLCFYDSNHSQILVVEIAKQVIGSQEFCGDFLMLLSVDHSGKISCITFGQYVWRGIFPVLNKGRPYLIVDVAGLSTKIIRPTATPVPCCSIL